MRARRSRSADLLLISTKGIEDINVGTYPAGDIAVHVRSSRTITTERAGEKQNNKTVDTSFLQNQPVASTTRTTAGAMLNDEQPDITCRPRRDTLAVPDVPGESG